MASCRPHCRHTGTQTIGGGPAAHHPPEAFNEGELRALPRQPLEAQRGMGCPDVSHCRSTLPGRLIDRHDYLGKRPGRRGARHILEMSGTSRLHPLRLALSRLRLAGCGLREQPCRQLPRDQIARRTTIDVLLVIPGPAHGPIPLHATRRGARGDEGQARCVVAQQHARSRLRFFFNTASSSWAACCFSGLPRR